MPQNIVIAGATYSNVPAVDLNKAGGGTARFVDSSDADAVASDILTGKTAYVNGQKITGTNSGGGGIPDPIVAGDTPVLVSNTLKKYLQTGTMSKTGILLNIPKTGTYRFKFDCLREDTSGTWTAQLYKNNSAVSGATATWSSYYGSCSKDLACNAGDTVEIWARCRSSSYEMDLSPLVAYIDWDNGFYGG